MHTPLVFLAIAVLLSCSKSSSYSAVVPSVVTPPPTAAAKTYLALGDSYTIGQSVSESERFPAQTVARLKEQGVNVANPVYIARTGWTTASLQSAIATENPSPTYDIVSLLIGVNDQYQRMDTGGYTQRFTMLLEKAIQLARGEKKHVFVLSIPDYSVTPFVAASEKERVRREVDQFNSINKRITDAFGVSYTDITPSTREAAANPSLIAADGLHPSGHEYRKWAEMLAPKVKASLQ
jgi:lysophospholipase L1-like esterase